MTKINTTTNTERWAEHIRSMCVAHAEQRYDTKQEQQMWLQGFLLGYISDLCLKDSIHLSKIQTKLESLSGNQK
jgi:hypothetical protein